MDQALIWGRVCVPWTGSAIGFVAACGLNYTLQKLWVFRSSRSHTVTLPRYVAITTVMLGVNTALFSGLLSLGLLPVPAQLVTTGCVFVLNYLGNSRITFAVRSRLGAS
ncbi:MAG TPA: GtrA family protein [Rhodopila sp.]|nr:GtrA family protein [Rhodopila sp.]